MADVIDVIQEAVYQLNQKEYEIEGWQKMFFEIRTDGSMQVLYFGGINFWSTENFDHDWTELGVEGMKKFLVERLKERLYMIRDLF